MQCIGDDLEYMNVGSVPLKEVNVYFYYPPWGKKCDYIDFETHDFNSINYDVIRGIRIHPDSHFKLKIKSGSDEICINNKDVFGKINGNGILLFNTPIFRFLVIDKINIEIETELTPILLCSQFNLKLRKEIMIKFTENQNLFDGYLFNDLPYFLKYDKGMLYIKEKSFKWENTFDKK